MTRSKKEIQTGALGYWANETVPDVTDLLSSVDVDPLAFTAWLGPKLADFRGNRDMQAALPTTAEELSVLEAVTKNINATWKGLQHSKMPPRAGANVHLIALDAGINWFQLVDRTVANLQQMESMLKQTERKLKARSTPSGRKPSNSRDTLAASVLKKVQSFGKIVAPPKGSAVAVKKTVPLKVQEARSLTRELLLRCGVPAPDDIKRSVNKGQKSPRVSGD
jgi:hypothetical protein